MSTYILMKILESAPVRYDRGIRILMLGKLDKAYDRLVYHIAKKKKVLDIGCGTGALTLRAAQRGAKVKGIDVNPRMLEIAQKRTAEAELTQNVKLCEMGVAELGSEKPESYDFVVSGLCFSELTEDELVYTLKESKRILKPGGLLLLADGVRPKSIFKMIFNSIIRFPLVVITYLITQVTIKALDNLPEKIRKSGFSVETIRFSKMENFMELVAKKPVCR